MEKAKYPGVDYSDHGTGAKGKILTEDSQKQLKEITEKCKELLNEFSSSLGENTEEDKLTSLSQQLEESITKIQALTED